MHVREAAALSSPPQYAWNFAGCQDGANVAPAAQGATQYLVTGMSFQHPSSQAQTWTPALTRGSFGALDLGEAAFNALFVASPTGIIKRLCPGSFKRLGPGPLKSLGPDPFKGPPGLF